ncbi:hypothetical protein FQA39_LY06910 [Lamprigera yunnana]|nr:hypothetical protein FQA39_LY06910 [Lamprigera yunnana]
MRKYHQLLLFITTVVSLSLLLVYRHQYNRLHYVLEVFNFFGHSCNISNLEYTDQVGGLQDWGVEPTWLENDDIYIYSAFWVKNEAQAIVLRAGPTQLAMNCYLWFEDQEKPLIGKFNYAHMADDVSNGLFIQLYHCKLLKERAPYAVSFSKKNRFANLKKVLLTFKKPEVKINTTICVAPTKFNKGFLVEFLSYHKLVGVNDFIIYESNIPYRLSKIISNFSGRLGFTVRFLPWNFPKNGNSLTRSIIERDCISRTSSYSQSSITLEINEFIVPSGQYISFGENFNKNNMKTSERISLPVQIFCMQDTHRSKPIVLQNVDVSYSDNNKVQYVYKNYAEDSTIITHAFVKNVISIHKYMQCLEKPTRVYQDNNMVGNYEMHRPLTQPQLLADLENLSADGKVDAVYIPPEVLTDEENLDDNILLGKEDTHANVVGSFEVHCHSRNVSNIEKSFTCKKRKLVENSKQQVKWDKTKPIYKQFA